MHILHSQAHNAQTNLKRMTSTPVYKTWRELAVLRRSWRSDAHSKQKGDGKLYDAAITLGSAAQAKPPVFLSLPDTYSTNIFVWLVSEQKGTED